MWSNDSQMGVPGVHGKAKFEVQTPSRNMQNLVICDCDSPARTSNSDSVYYHIILVNCYNTESLNSCYVYVACHLIINRSCMAFKLPANHQSWMTLKVTDNQYGRLS